MRAEAPIGIYQQTWAVESAKHVYYALVGTVDGETGLNHDAPSHQVVILQPLELTVAYGPEIHMEPVDASHKYKAAGRPIMICLDTFLGTYREGQPNFEFVENLRAEDIYQEAVKGIQQDTFNLGLDYIAQRLKIRHRMLHTLGWYENNHTKQVVRFLGVAMVGADAMAVLQDPHRGSLDPVILRPVQGLDPLTDEGIPDIWNGLQIMPLADFTAIYWVNEFECKPCYAYLGQDYQEVRSSHAGDASEVL